MVDRRSLLAGVLVLVLVLVVESIAGCASDDGTTSDSDSPVALGCGQGAPMIGERQIEVPGAPSTRMYLLGLPSDYDSDAAYPLVFAFHGAMSTAEVYASPAYGNLPAVAGEEAILVHGQALVVDGDTRWTHVSDLLYFDAVLAEVADQACVDLDRVFATGHSSGGVFTNRLGCLRGNSLRAIAPLAGGGPAFGDENPSCVDQVAAWIEHGVADDVVEITVGERSRDFWGERNACELGSPMETTPAGCVAYPGCDAGSPVHWCASEGGHEPRPEFTAPGLWEFFRALR